MLEVLKRTWKRPNDPDNTGVVLDSLFGKLDPEEPGAEYEAWARPNGELDLSITLNTRQWIEGRVDYEPRLNRLFYEKFLQYEPEWENNYGWDWREKIAEFVEWVRQHGGRLNLGGRDFSANRDCYLIDNIGVQFFQLADSPDLPLMREQYYSGEIDEFCFLQRAENIGQSMPVIFSGEVDDLLNYDNATLCCPNCHAWWDFQSYHNEDAADHLPMMIPHHWGAEDDRSGDPLVRDVEDLIGGLGKRKVRRHYRMPLMALGAPQMFPGLIQPPIQAAIERWPQPPAIYYSIYPERLKPVLRPRMHIWVEDKQIRCPRCNRAHLKAEMPYIG